MSLEPPTALKTTDDKPINVKMNIIGGKGSIIPRGVTETLKISIIDGHASYRFNDAKTTLRFSICQNEDGVKTDYVERTQWAISHYPNMTKVEIYDHIVQRIKFLSKNGK